MKNRLPIISALLLVIPSIFLMAGCYTQVGTMREGRGEGYDSGQAGERQAEEGYDSTENVQGNDYYFDNSGYPRNRFYLSYYYPSFYAGFGYYDPWYTGYYNPYYYDPFWCGTYYPMVYAGWGHYYPPYYYGYYSYGYHSSGSLRGFGKTRTIGYTRGGGNTRGGQPIYGGGSSGTSLPTGMRSASSTGRGSTSGSVTAPSVRKSPAGDARKGVRGASVGRGGNTRGGSRTQVAQPRTPQRPPQGNTPPSDNGGQRSGGERSGGGRSYTPPAPAPASPPSSAPAPPANTGARGGDNRGGGRR